MTQDTRKIHERYLFIFVILGILLLSASAISDDEIAYPPIKSIIMYNGGQSDFTNWGYLINDTNWHMCNGHNGTPDLKAKFVVGYDDELSDYEEIGNTGGEETHTLTQAETPYHEHNYNDIFHRVNLRGVIIGNTQNAEGYTSSGSTTTGIGGSQSHENRPPYYVVSYIIRVT